jgi:hypothetical protein
MKPSTVRVILCVIGGFFLFGLVSTLATGDRQGSRDTGVAIVGMLMLGGLLAGAWWIRTKPRRVAAEDAARALGLQYSGTDSVGLIDRPFPLLHRLATVRGLENVMFGSWQGHELHVFEYWYARSSNPSLNDFERFSCVVMPLPGWWPDLVIVPETLASRALDHLTMGEVNLESEAFNRSFAVRSSDPRFASALLDARMMAWLLERSAEWGFEVAGGEVLCYRSRVQPWELRQVLETASGFLDQVPEVVSGLFPPPTPRQA